MDDRLAITVVMSLLPGVEETASSSDSDDRRNNAQQRDRARWDVWWAWDAIRSACQYNSRLSIGLA
jgi:hypothetical protein